MGGNSRPFNFDTFFSSYCFETFLLDKVQQASVKFIKVLFCTICRCQNLLPASVLSVDSVMANPVTSVRDLDIYIYADLGMRTHV